MNELSTQQQRKAKEKNVTVSGLPHRVYVTCGTCGQGWSPNLTEGGHFPKRWWNCPNECNGESRHPGHIPSSEILPGAPRIERHEMMDLASRDAGLTAKERGR